MKKRSIFHVTHTALSEDHCHLILHARGPGIRGAFSQGVLGLIKRQPEYREYFFNEQGYRYKGSHGKGFTPAYQVHCVQQSNSDNTALIELQDAHQLALLSLCFNSATEATATCAQLQQLLLQPSTTQSDQGQRSRQEVCPGNKKSTL